MCMPVCTGMQPHLHYCACGCMVIPGVEEEVRMLESYKKRLEDELRIVDGRLKRLGR